MRNQSRLLGGAAVGVLLAFSLSAGAEAKTAKHHRAAGGDSTMAAKVDALTAAVSDLENRLNEEAQARQQLQAQAAAAQATAQAAQADAAAAHQQLAEQIQTIPGTVQSNVSTAIAANKPKGGWWDDTKIGGTMFANASYLSQSPRPSANANNVLNKNENGFNYDIKRFYISVDHKFNDMFSANITTDFTYDNATVSGQTAAVSGQTVSIPASALVSTAGLTCTGIPSVCKVPVSSTSAAVSTAVSGDKTSQLFVKKAYLQAKISDALIVRLGAADLPWVPFVEGLYGNRYVENVLIDRTKYGTSTDWGIHVFGALPVTHDLVVNYAVSGVNGLGYKQPGMGTLNRSDYMDVEGRISATYAKKYTVGIGGYEGKLGQQVQGIVTHNTAERFDAVAAYTDPLFHVGVEYFWSRANAAAEITSAATPNTAQGVSVFGTYNFTPKIAVFGRYDWVQPKLNTLPSYQENYFNIGVSYEPVKIVDLALVYKRDSIANGILATSNGSIGNVLGKTGTYDEIGLWTQVKW